jgi:hypothetical protein
MKNFRVGKNENIDAETRARAMASVEGLDRPKPSAGALAVPGMGGPVAAGTLTKKTPTVTKEELEKSGLSLRDYMNKQQGLTRRQDKVNPDMGAKADEAFSDFRKKLEAKTPPTASDVANQQRKEKLARLKLASARAESKMRQANASSMSRADFAGDAEQRGETPSDLKQDASEPETRTPKRADNLTDMLGLSSKYASGGAVSASRRGDGIAQRGKTRGKMC